jgi:hypothetical protein
MSTELPRLEARIGAQERMTTILHARIEELSQDMSASFRQLVEYQIQTERKIDTRFDKLEADVAGVRVDMATKADLASVRADMASMETRILDAFKQLIALVDSRLPAPKDEGK